ncbi:MAG TPA: CAP domain-containing protein [Solirubrobacteraceae bacterium]|nr:CAP domain-containing protein [Solirubrobacteraceae bacterium]
MKPLRTRTRGTVPVAKPESSSATSTAASVQRTDATIAEALATPCQNTELTPEAGNLELVRGAVLCLINRKRAEDGENPLVANPELEAAAGSHAQELIADDYFAHVSPSGETPVDRIRGTGYIPSTSVGYVIGENLAWGTYQLSTPQAIVAAWIASPGHLANILESQYVETGIAITPAVPESLAPGSPGATYAQEFGVIIP